MLRKTLLVFAFFAVFFLFKNVNAGNVYAGSFITGNLVNNGSIGITVTIDFIDGAGVFDPGEVFFVPAGGTYTDASSIFDPAGDRQPYSIRWGTSCSDPIVYAILSARVDGARGDRVYSYPNQDVTCTTPNATPVITNTACANIGWTLTGVGVDGANIASFSVYMSQNSSDVGPGDPVAGSLVASGLSPGTRSYDFGAGGKSGMYYVRVRAVSPQGVGSWSSVGSFTCGAAITPASNLNASASCAGSGAGNIVAVNFSWTPSSPPGNPQYLDYSVFNNNFSPGTYSSVNVTGASSSNFPTGFPQAVRFYWRVNNQISGNWYPSVTANFFTPSCPAGATPTPTPTPPPPVGTCPAGCTDPGITVSWSLAQFHSRVCLAGTGTCQPWSSTTGTSANWTVASLISYDFYVEISDGSNWYFWEKQSNVGRDCFGPPTCTMTFNWAQVDYIVRTTLDNTDHIVPGPTTSYKYFIGGGPYSYTGTVNFKDFDNFGNTHTKTNLSGSGSYTCQCPTPNPTPTPVLPVITLSGYSDCVDGVNPLVHLTWTSNTGATGYTVNRDSVNVTSQGLPNPLGSFDRSWNSTAAQPSGAHNWYVVGTGGSFPGTTSTTISITTATCSPPPADPSNLQVTSSCSASGPSLVFSWLNNASNETGYWMDVSHDAFSGPSSTVAALGGQSSVWGVKGISTTVVAGTTVQFTWNAGSALDSGDAYTGRDVTSITVTSKGSGYTSAPTVTISGGGGVGAQATAIISSGQVTAVNIVYGGKNYTSAPSISFSGGGGGGAVATASISTIGDTPLVPARGVTYTWRVKAYNASRQSNHVYPTSTTVPPGISFTTPTCKFDLQVSNNPAGNTQVYDPGTAVSFKVQVTNSTAAQVAYPGGGNLGAWTVSNTPSPAPNCSGTPVTPAVNPPTNTVQSIAIPTLAIGASTIITLANFTAPTAPGSYIANFYALPTCTPANDSNWTNNGFQLTYVVSAKAWFQTVGGDVGANGNIQVSNPTPPAAQSSYVLAGNPLDASVVGKWELNNYAHPLFPTNNTRVYDYLNSRFAAKATMTGCSIGAAGIEHCTGDMSVGATNMTTAGNWIIFVDGNLTVSGNITVGATTTLVFIVRNNITINTNVTQADGVYIAGGTFADYDNAVGKSRNTAPYQLLINGAVYAHAFDLSSFLSGLPACVPACDNNVTPADFVRFQPRYLITLSQLIGSPSVSWQEVAP